MERARAIADTVGSMSFAIDGKGRIDFAIMSTPTLAWPTPADADEATWRSAYAALDALYGELRLEYWDERTNRTIVEAEEIVIDYAKRELELLAKGL